MLSELHVVDRSVLCSQLGIRNRRLIETRAGSEQNDRRLHTGFDPPHHALTTGQEYKNSVEHRVVWRKLASSSGSEQVFQAAFLIYIEGADDIHHYN